MSGPPEHYFLPRRAMAKARASTMHWRPEHPSLTAWARACFEQGALASLLLLYLPGIVPVFTLPGDRMFQSTGIHTNVQRPVILHAYSGAYGVSPSNITIARMDPYGFGLVGTVKGQSVLQSVGQVNLRTWEICMTMWVCTWFGGRIFDFKTLQ